MDIMKQRKRLERKQEMLFLYGCAEVDPSWHVKEEDPASFCRIYYVHSGHVVYRDAQTHRTLQSGHLYIFPSTRPYEIIQEAQDPLNCLFLHVDIFPYLLSEIVELEVKENSFLCYLLGSIGAWEKNHPFSQTVDVVLEGLTQAMVGYLARNKLIQSVPDKIAETISYIAEHVQERITVKDISSYCGYHEQYYIRFFRECMGITPHQYLIHYRMKLGFQEMMAGKSVTETAVNVGYPEVRNFIRAFKKYYGFSPSQIKKYILPQP